MTFSKTGFALHDLSKVVAQPFFPRGRFGFRNVASLRRSSILAVSSSISFCTNTDWVIPLPSAISTNVARFKRRPNLGLREPKDLGRLLDDVAAARTATLTFHPLSISVLYCICPIDLSPSDYPVIPRRKRLCSSRQKPCSEDTRLPSTIAAILLTNTFYLSDSWSSLLLGSWFVLQFEVEGI